MPEPRARIHSIDVVRGVAMVLMALDHVRDFFGDFRVDPTDLATTTPALFLTRWITHFCAPVFVLLAGVGAFLHGARSGDRRALSRFLATRGLWLCVLEVTVVQFGWTGERLIGLFFVQVIAAIGVAMLALSALVWLPQRALLALGLAIVFGHNLLDPVRPADLGPLAPLWTFVHEGTMGSGGGPLRLWPDGPAILVVYPFLPWLGVMVTGYAMGPLFTRERDERRRTLFALGTAATLAFVLLRATGVYGDPQPWRDQPTATMTVAAFVDCEKYPPSLLYLLMTLGPAFVLLAWLDRAPGPVARRLETLGRVPLFYYVLHLWVAHAAARLVYWVAWGRPFSSIADVVRSWVYGEPIPDWYGMPLGVVWVAWIAIVLALYPACAWYAGVKRRRRSRLLSYL